MTTPPPPSEVQAAKERLRTQFSISGNSALHDQEDIKQLVISHDSLTARVAELEEVLKVSRVEASKISSLSHTYRSSAVHQINKTSADKILSAIQNAMKKEVGE